MVRARPYTLSATKKSIRTLLICDTVRDIKDQNSEFVADYSLGYQIPGNLGQLEITHILSTFGFRAPLIEKVGKVDLSGYEIPVLPEAFENLGGRSLVSLSSSSIGDSPHRIRGQCQRLTGGSSLDNQLLNCQHEQGIIAEIVQYLERYSKLMS